MNETLLIVTEDYHKAHGIIQQQVNELSKQGIYFEKHAISQYNVLTKFSNGLRIYWMPPKDGFLGCRISRLWVDNSINKSLIETIYEPMLIGYEDIIWI